VCGRSTESLCGEIMGAWRMHNNRELWLHRTCPCYTPTLSITTHGLCNTMSVFQLGRPAAYKREPAYIRDHTGFSAISRPLSIPFIAAFKVNFGLRRRQRCQPLFRNRPDDTCDSIEREVRHRESALLHPPLVSSRNMSKCYGRHS
jgi:hypothetical protein